MPGADHVCRNLPAVRKWGTRDRRDVLGEAAASRILAGRPGMTSAEVALGVSLSLEPCALFAIWQWRRCSRSAGWLVVGGTIILVMLATLSLAGHPPPARSYVGAGGVYLITALAWSWTVENLRSANWTPGEMFVGLLGMAMVLLAGA